MLRSRSAKIQCGVKKGTKPGAGSNFHTNIKRGAEALRQVLIWNEEYDAGKLKLGSLSALKWAGEYVASGTSCAG